MDFYSALIESYSLLKKRQLKLVVEKDSGTGGESGRPTEPTAEAALSKAKDKAVGFSYEFSTPAGLHGTLKVTQAATVKDTPGKISIKASFGKNTGSRARAIARQDGTVIPAAYGEFQNWFKSTGEGVPGAPEKGQTPNTSLDVQIDPNDIMSTIKPTESGRNPVGLNAVRVNLAKAAESIRNIFRKSNKEGGLWDAAGSRFSIEGIIANSKTIVVEDGIASLSQDHLDGPVAVDYLQTIEALLSFATGNPSDESENCIKVRRHLKYAKPTVVGRDAGRFIITSSKDEQEGIVLTRKPGDNGLISAALKKYSESTCPNVVRNKDGTEDTEASLGQKVTQYKGGWGTAELNQFAGTFKENISGFVSLLVQARDMPEGNDVEKKAKKKAEKMVNAEFIKATQEKMGLARATISRLKTQDTQTVKCMEEAGAILRISETFVKDPKGMADMIMRMHNFDKDYAEQLGLDILPGIFNTGKITGSGLKTDTLRGSFDRKVVDELAHSLGMSVIVHTVGDIRKSDPKKLAIWEAIHGKFDDENTEFYGIGTGDKLYEKNNGITLGATGGHSAIRAKIMTDEDDRVSKYRDALVDKFGYDLDGVRTYEDELHNVDVALENMFQTNVQIIGKGGKAKSLGQSKEMQALLKEMPKDNALKDLVDGINWKDTANVDYTLAKAKSMLRMAKLNKDMKDGNKGAREWTGLTMGLIAGSQHEEITHLIAYMQDKHFAFSHNELLHEVMEGLGPKGGGFSTKLSKGLRGLTFTNDKGEAISYKSSNDNASENIRQSVAQNPKGVEGKDMLKPDKKKALNSERMTNFIAAQTKLLAEFLEPE